MLETTLNGAAEPPGDLLGPLIDGELEPLFTRPTRIGPDSAWYGHLPFAAWIMRAARPDTFVELGTHAGISYAGFCDAVLACQLPTRCLAVDTWIGDEHAGFYGEDIYADFARFHDRRFGSFSRLLRCRFDEALPTVADGSVDLLHIDGRHRFADIDEDFHSWLPKLSGRGVVLLHDTNVRERDFGVWRFWAQIRERYPAFEFLHAHGLGVLAVGDAVPEPVLALCRSSGSQQAARIRERFALAGERWETEFALVLRDRQIAHLSHAQQQAAAGSRALSELQETWERQRALDLELALTRSALADAKAARHQAELGQEAMARRLQAELEVSRRLEARALGSEAAMAGAARLVAAREQELAHLRQSLSWRLTAGLRRMRSRWGAAPRAIPAATPEVARHESLPAPGADPQTVGGLLTDPVRAGSQIQAAPMATLRPLRHVLFVVGEPGTPGAAYRCVRNAAACRDAGYEAETVDLYDVNPDNLARADLLVLWRAGMSPHIETMIGLARAAGTRIAFDVDDLMTRPELARIEIIDGIRTIGTTEAQAELGFALMRKTMLAADFCICTTEELAREMRLQRDVVHVLPNIFDEATHRAARLARRHRLESGSDGMVRLGYAGGTRTHQKDFAQAAPALARVLAARPQAILVLFREATNHRSLLQMEEFPELEAFADRIEWRDMVPLDRLPAELARFDIAICPLQAGNPFCEAKSELKYFESSLAGACVVASPTGPYRRAIRHGVTGFLADDEAAWESVLLQLIDAPELRERVARDAYHDVLWAFGPRRQAELAAVLLAGIDCPPEGDARRSPAAARANELALRRGAYVAARLPEVPPSEVLFAHDQLGEAEVTVVMTSYNYEHYILEALDSVRAQSLQALDLAVVDDGSSDQSVTLVIEWAKRHAARFNRIRILRTRQNAGLGGARNVVFDAAETPFLMALDSDNRLLPEACATLLDSLRQVPQAAFAYPRIRQFGSSAAIMGEAAFEPQRLATGNYVDAMAMVAKWAWAQAGGYYVRRDAMGWEDFDLWLNLVEAGQFGIAVPEILAEYRVHANSMVNAITEQNDNKREMVRFVEAAHPWLRLRTRDARQRG